MLGQKSIHISTQQFIKSTSQGFEDSISKLPDDLLIEILLLLPTKNAASTIILSKRWRSLFTVLPQDMYFKLLLKVETFTCYHPIDFSLLKGCRICPPNKVDWLQPFMLFLQKSPKIEDLFIVDKTTSGFPLSFNPPISVPECLSMHLKIFEWQGYGGRKAEKEFVKYIFANSTCLITAYISIELTHRRHRGRKKNKLMKELTYMSRVSTSSQLIFPTQSKYDLYFHDDDWSDIFG